MPDVTGVLLAAGQSERFGSNKLLAEIDHRAMILHAATALSPCEHLLAVVRPDDLPLQKLLTDASIGFVCNENAGRGMGSSIACAVAASSDSLGWCLLPGDMPYIQPSTTQRVAAALREGAAIAAPIYDGRRGHPVGFSNLFANELLALDGAAGARDIVELHLDQFVTINCDDKAVLVDIDTVEDLH